MSCLLGQFWNAFHRCIKEVLTPPLRSFKAADVHDSILNILGKTPPLAKDKSFKTTLKTDYDKSIGCIDIIPQDIGRVLLNLIDNAFYAVSASANARSDADYQPMVTVGTKRIEGKIEIWVSDNGMGIPPKVLDKIFQPFFTTKPTGQGTGLGLSLSYDIVKAHGGELRVESTEGDGSTFIINLPVE